MTGPKNLEAKAIHLKYSWTRHCNVVLFMSSTTNDSFPTIGLNTKEGRDQLYWKTIRAFQYIHKNYSDQADWFFKADDDTYVVVENLRWMLSNYTSDQPVYFGKRFKPFAKQGYMSGGAGYVLSKEALNRFVDGFHTGVCQHTTSVEDLALGQCMEKMGVIAGDSRDTEKRETFHPFPPESHLTGHFDKSFLVLELLFLSNCGDHVTWAQSDDITVLCRSHDRMSAQTQEEPWGNWEHGAIIRRPLLMHPMILFALAAAAWHWLLQSFNGAILL
ncbi:unnamed protein product [Ranitomeya imitator]|uniref:N-acetylgalactosaminide beta-1,3-galactosyltransferase n=1 Tax=Ranitomeya imitator TaxID=111125 RepID=A0ABN9L1Q4_9NEOB|nr:unnamed protein product [Ranitomeya imitator]